MNDFAKSQPLGISTKKQYKRGFDGVFDVIMTGGGVDLHRTDTKNMHIANIEFDFLRPRCGIYIEILHEGDVTIQGEMKNGKIVNSIDKSLFSKEDRELLKKILGFSLLEIIYGCAGSAGLKLGGLQSESIPLIILLSSICLPLIIIFSLLSVTIIYNLLGKRRRFLSVFHKKR